MLSDLSVIPTPPELKNLPDSFELGIKVDPYFVSHLLVVKVLYQKQKHLRY